MEINDICRRMKVPEHLRNGRVKLYEPSLIYGAQVDYDIDFPKDEFSKEMKRQLNVSRDTPILKFKIYDFKNDFTAGEMLSLIEFMKSLEFGLLHWDFMCNMYFFFFIVPKMMDCIDSPISLMKEIGLSIQDCSCSALT